MFEVGDRSRMFLAWAPGVCSEELLLLHSVREEKVQSLSQMRRKGCVGMVLTGVRAEGSSP